MKLIELYKQWMETGKIGDLGLCNSLNDKYYDDLSMFRPTVKDFRDFKTGPIYWGYDLPDYYHGLNKYKAFNPLRQNIVLFICAMNNEL